MKHETLHTTQSESEQLRIIVEMLNLETPSLCLYKRHDGGYLHLVDIFPTSKMTRWDILEECRTHLPCVLSPFADLQSLSRSVH